MTCLVSLSSALDPHKYVVYNGRKLYEFREKMNFFEAFLHCESLNLQLLTLRSVDEFVDLNNIMYTSFDGYEYWMGAYKLESGWKYLSNGKEVPDVLPQFGLGCVYIYTTSQGLMLSTHECVQKYYVICES